MTRLLDHLNRALEPPLPAEPPARWVVAFSGGLDSTALLHGLVQSQGAARVRAVHVNHGLLSTADQVARRCERVAARLAVEFTAVRVQVNVSGSVSVEAAAREVRYAALAENLQSNEILLTAHHADDQLETMLLALLRGAGLRGLRGALASTPFGPGWLMRPLLHLSRAEIRAWATQQGLDWMEDPSNLDTRFDRNFLRHEVLPGLLARWPAAGSLASRAADHLDGAVHLTEELARHDIAGLDDRQRPSARQVERLAPHRQRNLLRAMLRDQALPLPSAAQLELVLKVIAGATPTSRSVVQWGGAEMRLYRGRLYLAAPLPEGELAATDLLTAQSCWRGPLGRLTLTAGPGDGLPEPWAAAGLRVGYSTGGERFQPAGAQRPRSLARLFQEARIVPWLRPFIPLLYFDDALVAVADLWVSQRAAETDPGAPQRYQVNWLRSRPIF